MVTPPPPHTHLRTYERDPDENYLRTKTCENPLGNYGQILLVLCHNNNETVTQYPQRSSSNQHQI